MTKAFITAAVVSLGLAACTAHEQRTAGGALIGAGAGALIGGAATGRAGGALAGAAIGGVGGAIVGSATSPTRTCVGRDRFGRRVRFDC